MVYAVAAFQCSLRQRQALQAGSAKRLLDHLSGTFPDRSCSLIGGVYTHDGSDRFEGRREVGGQGNRIGDAHGRVR